MPEIVEVSSSQKGTPLKLEKPKEEPIPKKPHMC
jgi:hypothetical protein